MVQIAQVYPFVVSLVSTSARSSALKSRRDSSYLHFSAVKCGLTAIAAPEVSIPMEQSIFRDIRVHGSLLCSPTGAQRMLDLVAKKNITVKSNPFCGLSELPKLIDLAQGGKMAGKGILVVDEKEVQHLKKEFGRV